MTDHDSIEAAIREDPDEFEERVAEIRLRLTAADLHARLDAGRAFRAVAAERPAALEDHLGTLLDLLGEDNGSLQLSGATGIAGLAETAPESADEAVPALVARLERTDAPAVQMAILRALSRIGTRSPESVAVADGAVADLLRTATPQIRLAVVTVFASVPVRQPSALPATVRATEAALEDDDGRVRRCAAATLAQAAETDPSALSSVGDVLERVEALHARSNARQRGRGETLERAVDGLRAVDARRSERD